MCTKYIIFRFNLPQDGDQYLRLLFSSLSEVQHRQGPLLPCAEIPDLFFTYSQGSPTHSLNCLPSDNLDKESTEEINVETVKVRDAYAEMDY